MSLRPRQRWLALGLMLAMAGHGLVGFWSPDIPSWRMFKFMERFDYSARDRSGALINLQDYVPRNAYWMMSRRFVLDMAAWYAAQDPEAAPVLVQFETPTRPFGPLLGRESYFIVVDADGRTQLMTLGKER